MPAVTSRGEVRVLIRLLCAVALGSAVVGLGGCAVITSAPADAAASPIAASTVPTPAPSGTATGHALVQGTVRGATKDRPATVRVLVWPHDDDTGVGEVVDTWESPAVTTDSVGRWSIDVDPASLSPKYLSDKEPYINFDVVVLFGKTGGTQWSTSAQTVGDGGLWRSMGASADDRIIDVVMDLSAGQITFTDSLGETTTSPLVTGTFETSTS